MESTDETKTHKDKEGRINTPLEGIVLSRSRVNFLIFPGCVMILPLNPGSPVFKKIVLWTKLCQEV